MTPRSARARPAAKSLQRSARCRRVAATGQAPSWQRSSTLASYGPRRLGRCSTGTRPPKQLADVERLGRMVRRANQAARRASPGVARALGASPILTAVEFTAREARASARERTSARRLDDRKVDRKNTAVCNVRGQAGARSKFSEGFASALSPASPTSCDRRGAWQAPSSKRNVVFA